MVVGSVGEADALQARVRQLRYEVDSSHDDLSALQVKLENAEEAQRQHAQVLAAFREDTASSVQLIGRLRSMTSLVVAQGCAESVSRVVNGSDSQHAQDSLNGLGTALGDAVTRLMAQIAQKRAEIATMQGQIDSLLRQITALSAV